MVNSTYSYDNRFVFYECEKGLSRLRKQPIRHIRAKKRLRGDFRALKIPIRKSMKRMMVLRRGGMLYIFVGYPEITTSYEMVQGNSLILINNVIINKYIQ
jgi:hypothetical protein